MTSGKIVVSMLLLVALLTGVVMYYLQVHAFYEPVEEPWNELTGAQEVVLTDASGTEHPVAITDFRAIDATSSPIRYRACFEIDPAAVAATARSYEGATPLNGPGWFRCYSARALTADLETGAATAYLGEAEIRPDVDRVIAVYPDGRAFAWHQLNDKTPERGVMDSCPSSSERTSRSGSIVTPSSLSSTRRSRMMPRTSREECASNLARYRASRATGILPGTPATKRTTKASSVGGP